MTLQALGDSLWLVPLRKWVSCFILEISTQVSPNDAMNFVFRAPLLNHRHEWRVK